MRDHVAQCAQIDPVRRAEMSQLIALKEAAAVAKQEEKAQMAEGGGLGVGGSATKKKKTEHPPLIAYVVLFSPSWVSMKRL